MSDNKNNNDSSKTLSNLANSSSRVTEIGFDKVDRAAKGVSTFIEKHSQQTETQESSSRLSTSESKNTNRENSNNFSRLKTNVNEPSASKADKKNKSNLKTNIKNTINKVIGLNENQGKISKTVSVVSKTGKTASKLGGFLARTSKKLDTAIKNEDIGTKQLQSSAGRLARKTANKTIGKKIKKTSAKLMKSLIKQLMNLIKNIIAKLIKIIVALFGSSALIMIAVSLIIIALVVILSIFGSNSSASDMKKYQTYMTTIQENYNKKVDDFIRENPNATVYGINGNYGEIDWRVPLSILQATDSKLTFDNSEKQLLDSFDDAGLFEVHEIVEQDIEDFGEPPRKEKILIISNPGYTSYVEYLNKDFSTIQTFMKSKGKSIINKTSFDKYELEIIQTLSSSTNFYDAFDMSFNNHIAIKGKNISEDNFNHAAYTTENPLAKSGYKGQCTWYAWGRAYKLTGKEMPTGNAQTWIASAIKMGLPTGTHPSKNAIVVSAGGSYGHVAFVEAYDGTSITISEGNVGNPCGGSKSTCSQVDYANKHALDLIRERTYSSYEEYKTETASGGRYIIGFIYLE